MNLKHKLTSVFLAMLMLLYALPLTSLASDESFELESNNELAVSDQVIDEAYTDEELSNLNVIGEVESLRSETAKHYRLENGLYAMMEYGQRVHYKDANDKWVDYDNTLVLNPAVRSTDKAYYTVKSSDVDIRISADTSAEKLVSMSYNGYSVSMTPIMTSASKISTAEVTLKSIGSSEQLSKLDSASKLPNFTSTVKFNELFLDSNVQYIVSGPSIKENIIVNKKSDDYTYRFVLTTGSLVPVIEDNGDISLKNELDEAVFVIPKGYMYDSAKVYSDSVAYSLQLVKTGTYILTVTPDNTWMNDENRVFPITVDPTIDVGTHYDNEVEDVGVSEASPNTRTMGNIYTAGSSTPNSRQRIFIKMKNPSIIPASAVVVSACLTLYELPVGDYESYISEGSNNYLPFAVRKVTSSWSENTISWNNQPSIDPTILDVQMIDNNQTQHGGTYYSWYITDLMRGWCQGTIDNNGIVLYPVEEYTADNYSKTSFFSSEYLSDSHYTQGVFTIIYRDDKGIEERWSFNSHSASSSSTGNINLTSGNLVYIHNDITSHGSVLPVNVSHVYNSANLYYNFTNVDGKIITADFSNMLVGIGFKLSVQETIVPKSINYTTYYVYNDQDGTELYFRWNSSENAYVSEDGYGLKITKDSSGIYTMSDEYGNTKTFNSSGYITELKDVWGNKQVYTYSSGKLNEINYYPSGETSAKYKLKFSYNSSNYLNKIQSVDTATGTVIAYTEFLYGTYNGTGSTSGTGYLREIKRYSGTTLAHHTKIDYNSATIPGGTSTNGLIAKVTDVIVGSQVEYTYASSLIEALDRDRRIYSIKEKYGDSTGQQLGFTYGDKKTSIRTSGKDDTYNNSDDILTTYLFDNYGRTINAYTSDLNGTKVYGVTNAEYNTTDQNDFSGTYRKNNTITKDAYTGTPATNYVINNSAEYSGGWTSNVTSTSQSAIFYTAGTGQSYVGTKSFRLYSSNATGTAKMTQNPSIPSAGYYTLSAYVKTSNVTGTGAYITLNGTSSEKITGTTNSEINNGWQRISVTTAIMSPAVTIELVLANSNGAVYFDCIQLEKNDTPSAFNFISNTTTAPGWSVYPSSSTAITKQSNGNIVIVGDGINDMYVYQDIYVNLPATTAFVLSGWATANSVNADENTLDGVIKNFSYEYQVYYSDTVYESPKTIKFNDDNTNRQFTSGTIIPEMPIDEYTNTVNTIYKIRIRVKYSKNCNTAIFETPSLVIAPAQYYDYDDKGNLTQSVNSDGNATNVVYADNKVDIESYTNILGEKYEYTYYSLTHAVKTQKKTDYEKTLTTEYEYDEFGNTTSTTVKNNQNSLVMSSSSEYDDIGDFLTSVTDGRGIVTNYTYDTLKELLTSTNVGGNRVYRYLYDTKDRITKVYLDRDKDSVVDSTDEAVSYVYNSKGYLSSLTTPNSGTYTIAYDNFGNTSSIKAGSFTLAQYVYNANNGKLNKTTYGNGFYTENVYDELDRIIQIKYNGVVKYSFKYNGDGQLYSATDVPNNTITYYEYDSNGRLLRAKLKENTSTGSVLLNTENKFDNLGRAVKSVYDLQKLGEKMTYTVTYKGNADIQSGRIASFTLPSNHSISYNYDAFERLTQKQLFIGTGAIPTEKFGYYTSGNKTVNLISSHTINVNNTMSNPQSQVIYNYTYDDYGNILTVKEGSTLKLSYVYDELNQLTRENNAYANKTYVYTYDKNGNILTKKTYAYTTGTLGAVQSTVNYTYGNSSWKDLLTNYNGTAISYDGSGNPTNWRGNLNTLTWTGRELTGITMPSSQTMSYKYNSDGIRTQKTFTDNAVKYYYKHDYILDGANIVAETINYVTYMGTNTTEVLYYYYDEAGAPTGIKYNGNVYYFQKNLQGDIIRILNTSGTIVATYTYDAWGNIIASTDTSGVSIGTKNPFRYRGYYYDTETSLYYLNSRYYDPQVGRFISADSSDVLYASPQEFTDKNLFAYCDNNPVTREDNGGAFWDTVFDVVSLVMSAADVIANPANPWAWAGMIGDVVDLIPGVTGVGEVTRALGAAKKAGKVLDDVHDAKKAIENMAELAEAGQDGYKTFKTAKKHMENASDIEWHHLVEQSQINRSGIAKTSINNSSNLVGISEDLHHKISGFYSSKPAFLKNSEQYKTVRDWVSTLNYQQQYTFGVFVLQSAKYMN